LLLGRYRSVRPLAHGGMGVVHLGRVEGAQGFAKPVVIKTMLASGSGRDDRAQLFVREARIVSQLQHPGIVAVIDFGEASGSHVMVLEYVHGYNLGQWFRFVSGTRGQMPLAHAVHVVLLVLDALGYAHGLTRPDGAPLGIVHRDISPGNVLIDVQGHVKLADFGIARTADDEFKTQEGLFRGTLPYSPPESLEGGSVDSRSDQYACAVILYQLVTGTNPFKGGETANTIARILTHVPAPLSAARPDVPPAIEAAVMKALSRSRDDRFASAGEFAEALRKGATWSERDAAREFTAQIAQDFTGELPERLGLESLALRDAAWREAQDSSDTSRVALSTSPPDLRSAITKRDSGTAPSTTAELPQGAQGAAVRPSSRVALWFGVAAAVALVAVLAVVLLRPSNANAPAPIIVEKQSLIEPAATPVTPTTPGTLAPGARAASASAPAATPSAPTPSASAAAKSDSGSTRRTLASAFQRRQGAIQHCFTQNPDALAETQRISVRFEIDRNGHVVSSTLSPPSLAGQPLGACILGVARGTDFGPQSEAMSFVIPISARMVAR
jgi:eukaryotic-like serine/threonine-protein kinase